ncbi:photosystem I biogenesis protein BtpA [Gloeobacter morelensis]|uniref:BtpA/SgcQ family protein n=1 Tax=Gloeobacter morelensis MG652769 TaxID=2781736 RepID=A0ABY3PLW0_9CYAN|nr:BtpA/SgcQ family protein [Gloeobacter morelensis]UFP94641.1 BtpA/SgcQ family protein [Gloeobacter morelensis MG652769]
MSLLLDLFSTAKPIIGVVHLLPLPTAPRWAGSLDAVMARAEQEATALATGGVDALIVENYYDAPFVPGRVDPAVVAAMSLVVKRIIHLVPVPVGVNVLRNDAHAALAVAACTGAQFIRVNILTGTMATDQGIIQGEAHSVLRYRRELGAETRIFADVLVKHASPLGAGDLFQACRDTVERGLADGIIVSGVATGSPPRREDLVTARAAVPDAPILIGSGADPANAGDLLGLADGVIVASALKRFGKPEQPIDPHRTRQFVDAVHLAADGVGKSPLLELEEVESLF